jgi:hypothetical protein
MDKRRDMTAEETAAVCAWLDARIADARVDMNLTNRDLLSWRKWRNAFAAAVVSGILRQAREMLMQEGG